MIKVRNIIKLKTNISKPLKISNLILLLLFIGLNVSFAENSYAQSTKISLEIKNKSLKEVFREIEKMSEFVIFYSDNVIESNKKVSIKATQQTIEEILDQLLAGQNYSYRINGKQVFITDEEKEPSDVKQNAAREIKGQVTDEKGETLPGVSITIKGTQLGTVTNINGDFTIRIEEGKTLIFSYLGYEPQEVTITNQTNLNIALTPRAEGLDEVVIIGMNNQQTKRAVTGSIATIQTKELKQSPVANLSNALAGRLPGLITVQSSGQPGQDAASLYIRGQGTYGNSAPLIVIDGLPRAQADLNQLDANEVESITILKDAASSALYGIQGANGVVVVTTKRGAVNTAPQINVTAQFAVQQPIRLPRVMDSYNQALYEKEVDYNTNMPVRFTDEVLEIIRTNSQPYLYPNVQWADVILKDNSFQSQYNLNLSGSAGGKIRYFISGSYINQGTLLNHMDIFKQNYNISPKFDRYNFRSNIDLDVTSMLTLRVDLAGRLGTQVGPSTSFGHLYGQAIGRSPFAHPILNPDGSIGAGSALAQPLTAVSPYGLLTNSGYHTINTNVMYGTLSAKQKLDFITKGLEAQLFFSFENNNESTTYRTQNFDSFWYKGEDEEGIPIYQQHDIGGRLVTSGSRFVQRYSYLDFRLNYRRQFNNHNVFGQILGNRTLRTYNDDLPYAYQGLSVHATYDYLSRYFLELNFGYNGSENFPPGKRYGFFPAMSVGWLISDEPFLKDFKNLNLLKIRASHGEVGNDKIEIGGVLQRWLYISDYKADGGYEFGVSPVWKPGFNEITSGNSLVTWERSKKSNIGLDLSLFKNNMIQLSFDLFREKRENILTKPGDVPSYVAIPNFAARNTGAVLNKGFEVELRLDKMFGEWRVFSTIQFTYAKNKVLENDAPIPAFPYQDLRGYEVGHKLGYKALGLFKDQAEIDNSPLQTISSDVIPGDIKYLDYNEDGVINDFDRVPIKSSSLPRYVGGVSVGVSYKGFDASFLLTGAGGNQLIYQPRQGSLIQLDRWTPDNLDAKAPIASVSDNNDPNISDFYLQDASYLKLRNAEIGYELPRKILAPVGLKYARIYLNGQNLATWDRLFVKDKDPEMGEYNANYPLQRIINIGLSLRF